MTDVVSYIKRLYSEPAKIAVDKALKKDDPETRLSSYVKEFYPLTARYVYLIHAEGTNRYKIGKTKSIQRRGQEIKSQSPYPLILVDFYWSPDADSDEKWLHGRWENSRVYGEWFEFEELTELAIEQFPKTRYSHIPLTIKSTHLLTQALCSEIKGADFVLHGLDSPKERDLFCSSVHELISNLFLSCDSVGKVAYVCAFLEKEIPLIAKDLIEQDMSNNDWLTKTKESIHGPLFYFLHSLKTLGRIAP